MEDHSTRVVRGMKLVKCVVAVVFCLAASYGYRLKGNDPSLGRNQMQAADDMVRDTTRKDLGSNLIQADRVSRRLLFSDDVSSGVGDDSVNYVDDDDDDNCTERGINSFPDGVFTIEQRLNGALVVNFLVALYLCGVIGYVCSVYFVPSLEILCEHLHLQPDVAGATFMAAGSSAPEFFTSVIGIFMSHDDTGLSAIVGSAAFNIFVIISFCCFFTGHVIVLHWWPFTRDCSVYLISIILMVIFIQDYQIEWWEGLILAFGYVFYIAIMYFNPYLTRRADDLSEKWKKTRGKYSLPVPPDTEPLLAGKDSITHYSSIDQEADPEHSNMSNGTLIVRETKMASNNDGDVEFHGGRSRCSSTITSGSLPGDRQPLSEQSGNVFALPDTWPFRVLWFIGLPVILVTFLTIPDCRKPGIWRKCYFLTFSLATAWLGATSYILYWMIAVIGYTLDIPDTVMGVSLLAGGTSVPDLISSVLVARDGYGDMALSNIIGSNIFEVFVCLGFLWFVYGLAYQEPVEITSQGLGFSTISLILTVAFIFLAIHLNGWKLDVKMGIICIVVYLVFISFAIVWELGYLSDYDVPDYCDGPD